MNWTQKELANMIDIRFQLLNKYEGGQHIPPAETLVKLSESLNTTIDYLLVGNPVEKIQISNPILLKRFKELESFSSEDQQTVIKVIDAMIAKQRIENAMKPL